MASLKINGFILCVFVIMHIELGSCQINRNDVDVDRTNPSMIPRDVEIMNNYDQKDVPTNGRKSRPQTKDDGKHTIYQTQSGYPQSSFYSQGPYPPMFYPNFPNYPQYVQYPVFGGGFMDAGFYIKNKKEN